jgi:hypothetical protein
MTAITVVKAVTPSISITPSTPTISISTGVQVGGGGGGVTDHGALTGLADDDHAHYALADGSRGDFATPLHTHDSRYYTESEADTLLGDKAPLSHTHPGIFRVYFCVPGLTAANNTWTNMPAAETLLFGVAGSIQYADLTGFTQVRFHVNKLATAGAASSKLILKYAGSYTQTVGSFANIGASEVSVAINVANTYLMTAWTNLAAGATGVEYLTVTGSGGDGVIDPIIGSIFAEFK